MDSDRLAARVAAIRAYRGSRTAVAGIRDEHARLERRMQDARAGATALQGKPPGNTSARAEKRKALQLEREQVCLATALEECAARLQTELARLAVVRAEWIHASTGFPMVGELWEAHDRGHNGQLRIVTGITERNVQLKKWGSGPKSKSDRNWTVPVDHFVRTNRQVRVIEPHDGRLRMDEVGSCLPRLTF